MGCYEPTYPSASSSVEVVEMQAHTNECHGKDDNPACEDAKAEVQVTHSIIVDDGPEGVHRNGKNEDARG